MRPDSKFRRALGPDRPTAATARRAALAIVVLAMLLAALPAIGAEPKSGGAPAKREAAAGGGRPDTWYAATYARSGDEFRIVHYWAKGRRFRAESIIAGHPLVTIVSGRFYYTIDLLSGKGVGIERSPAALADDARGGRPFGTELMELKAGGGERIRTEKAGDVELDVWQLTDTDGRRKVWATQGEEPVPVRVETWVRQSNRTGELSYMGWQVGLLIPDRFFEPPADVELQRMTYDEYMGVGVKGPAGPAPVLYRHLLHGLEAGS